MHDKIVVTIEPSGPSNQLDIADAFQQVLDYLRLVELAASEEADFDWKLEKASTNSPFTVVAFTPTGSVASKRQQSLAVAQRRAEDGLKQLADGSVPPWMSKRQRNTARRITRRFHESIGRMALRADEGAASAFLVNRSLADRVLSTLEKVDGIEEVFVPKHRAFGEVEGTLLGAGSYYGKPALWVRVNGYDVVRCIVEQEKLDELGDEATLGQLWKHRRVRLIGTQAFAEGGVLEQVTVDEMHLFPATKMDIRQIIDAEFTGGMEPIEYLDRLREGELH